MWVFFPQDVAKNYISKYKEGSAKQTDVVLFAQHNKRQLRSLEARLPPSYAKENQRRNQPWHFIQTKNILLFTVSTL